MKYMGSKSRIAKYIVPIIQYYIDKNNIDTYIENFVGGANVIDKVKCENKIGSDLNKYLIALLNRVKNDLPLYDEVSREFYNIVKQSYNNNTNEFEDWQIGNVGFLASFNGKWFDGGYAKTGYEKTKNGLRLRNYYQESKRNILKQAESPEFKNCIFKCCNYSKYSELGIKNALIYCDPPYQNTTSFQNSTNFDYDKFWQWCRDMSKENIVLISELQAPDDFECIWQQEISRSMKVDNKTKATEKLFILKDKKGV